MNRRLHRWISTALLVAACTAAAQDYPDKTVRLVVAYPPLQLPQRVIVDNRPGAGGIIGTELVANASAARMSVEQKLFAQVIKDANIRAE